jgi:hypothetical protein
MGVMPCRASARPFLGQDCQQIPSGSGGRIVEASTSVGTSPLTRARHDWRAGTAAPCCCGFHSTARPGSRRALLSGRSGVLFSRTSRGESPGKSQAHRRLPLVPVRLLPVIGSRRAGGRILVLMKPARAASRRLLPGSPFNAPVAPPVEQFTVRDRVTHDKYGLGWVVLVEDDDDAVIVDFGSRKVRILSPFARLTKL